MSTRARKPGRGTGGRAEGRSKSGDAVRRHAIQTLVAVERGRLAGDLLAKEDDRFLRELVMGVLRRRLTLDAVHDAWGNRPAVELDAEVRAAVRVGLYQYLFMDGVPPHAAVSTSAGAVRASGRGYVNAVLRSVLRESRKVPEAEDRGGASPTKRLHRPGRSVVFFSRAVFPDPERDRIGSLSMLHSHPRLLVERWVARMGEADAIARMEAGNTPPPISLRPRAGRIDAEALMARLQREEIAAALCARPGGPDAVNVGTSARGLLAGRTFREGLFSVQGVEQMDAAEILDPQPGEAIWDACAAPGGKTGQLAELLAAHGQGAQGGRIVATDQSEERLSRVVENMARLGLEEHVTVAQHDLLGKDAPPDRPERGFDAILLDAPCSNTAVLARRPEARWRLEGETFARMAELQARMLDAALPHLAPGGRLVYSVCSLEPEEGADLASAQDLVATRSPLVWLRKGS
jgi:16S rRNA (cytosine967-C5)-methyltransferase